jgi:hypothetical protein
MGCLNSKASEDDAGEGRGTPQKEYIFENENRDGANDPRRPAPALLRRSSETAPVAEQSDPPSRRAHHSSEGAITISSFGTEHYPSKKNLIVSVAAGKPHPVGADEVNNKLQEIREGLEGHNNDIITDAERAYFIEQRCWDFFCKLEAALYLEWHMTNSPSPRSNRAVHGL